MPTAREALTAKTAGLLDNMPDLYIGPAISDAARATGRGMSWLGSQAAQVGRGAMDLATNIGKGYAGDIQAARSALQRPEPVAQNATSLEALRRIHREGQGLTVPTPSAAVPPQTRRRFPGAGH